MRPNALGASVAPGAAARGQLASFCRPASVIVIRRPFSLRAGTASGVATASPSRTSPFRIAALYTRPRDPDYPLVCLDESSKQLIGETRVPISMKPGRPVRCDCEYERHGTANLFMMARRLAPCQSHGAKRLRRDVD